MKRVEEDGDWTLMDPHEVNNVYGRRIEDTFGTDFEIFYTDAEKNPKLKLNRTIKAKDLFKVFLKSTVETGMPYVFFRDTVNRLNPNKHAGSIYSTQLCTEICQNSSPSEFIEEKNEDGVVTLRYKMGDTVTCNLASINVAKVNSVKDMEETVPVLMRILDNVVTITKYPIKEAERTSLRYRPKSPESDTSDSLNTSRLTRWSMILLRLEPSLTKCLRSSHGISTATRSIRERKREVRYDGSEYDK